MEIISQTKIKVKINSILGNKLDERADAFQSVKFNISANLEEVEHGFDNVLLRFGFIIVTEPKVVKYHVEGQANIQGQMDHIRAVLSPHPTTKVPVVLYDVYQQTFAPIFVLAKVIEAPCPSPELLSLRQAYSRNEREMPVEEEEYVEDEYVAPDMEEEMPAEATDDELPAEQEDYEIVAQAPQETPEEQRE